MLVKTNVEADVSYDVAVIQAGQRLETSNSISKVCSVASRHSIAYYNNKENNI